MIVSRYHDISCGHRVVGHPGKCRFVHGHNYRIHFYCEGEMENLGMVIDFSVIKATLCEFLESQWDHKLLLWESDPIGKELMSVLYKYETIGNIVFVPFNPTAENMAHYLVNEIGPMVLPSNVILQKVVVEETRKCSAQAEVADDCLA